MALAVLADDVRGFIVGQVGNALHGREVELDPVTLSGGASRLK
jgi:hypothetical protein